MSGYLGRLACPRCSTEVEESAYPEGCPRCAEEGVPVNVHPVYDLQPSAWQTHDGRGVFARSALLPLQAGTAPVSLGEGDTPLLRLRSTGEDVGLEQLYLKDETRNPTWSYKDRLAALAITKARADGAGTVVVSTTGNHGAAVAAYAAAAGMRCVALTLTSVPLTMKVLMQSYGARVVALERGPDRWRLMRAAVAELGWVPVSGLVDPPIGSNPFGIDGYKTIAYELFEELGRVPDVVVVPTAYADGLAGIHRGFVDLVSLDLAERVPRMVAAEPLGPYAASLAGDSDVPARVEIRPSVAFSIAGNVATYQGVAAIRSSGGTAVAVAEDDEIIAAQLELASREGLYLEASAAIVVPALRRLEENGAVERGEVVVAIGTSSGLKDVAATAGALDEVPVVAPDLADLQRALSVMVEPRR